MLCNLFLLCFLLLGSQEMLAGFFCLLCQELVGFQQGNTGFYGLFKANQFAIPWAVEHKFSHTCTAHTFRYSIP